MLLYFLAFVDISLFSKIFTGQQSQQEMKQFPTHISDGHQVWLLPQQPLLPPFVEILVTALPERSNGRHSQSPFSRSAFVFDFMPRFLSRPCYLSTSAQVLLTLTLGLSNKPRKLNEAKLIHSFPFTTMLWLGGLGKRDEWFTSADIYVSAHMLPHYPLAADRT